MENFVILEMCDGLVMLQMFVFVVLLLVVLDFWICLEILVFVEILETLETLV